MHLARDLRWRRLLGGADLQPHLVDQMDDIFPRARRLLLHRRAQLVLAFRSIVVSGKRGTEYVSEYGMKRVSGGAK